MKNNEVFTEEFVKSLNEVIQSIDELVKAVEKEFNKYKPQEQIIMLLNNYQEKKERVSK